MRTRAIPRQAPRPNPTDVIGSFFLAAIAMALAALAAAIIDVIDPWPWGRWLALHLVFVGGISQLILGASQFFSGAFLATDQPPRALIRFQLLAWNLGTVAIAVGVPLDRAAVSYAGVALLLAALLGYAIGLLRMRRRSLNRAPWATRWYLAAAASLAIGVTAGTMLATRTSWSHGDLLGSHMALNLGGWFGLTIVGTLHTFFPSLTGSRLRLPRLQGPTYSLWSSGVWLLALGYGFSRDAFALAGWTLLLIASTMLSANIIGSLLAGSRPLALAPRIIAVAQIFLVGGLITATSSAALAGPAGALGGSTRAAVATMLVAGWIGLTVAGSLLHLLALLLRVRSLRREMPAPRPRRDTVLTAFLLITIGAAAIGQSVNRAQLEMLTIAAMLVGYAMLASQLAPLAWRILLDARPRI